MLRFHRTYPSNRETIRDIRHDIETFARSCSISEDEISEITVATGEASSNAIEHGHVPESTVEVDCWFESDELWFSIEDPGGGLNPSDKTWMRAVHKPGEGGYGLLLMKTFMDEVKLVTVPGDGAKVVMRKRREQPGLSP